VARDRIVIATGNAGKAREITQLFSDLPVEWVLMHDIGTPPVVVEDGDSFQANSLIKARAISDWAGLPALADDSGLEVDALDGAPGVYSARFAGMGASDDDNVALLLDRMTDVPDPERTARFRAVMTLRWTGGHIDQSDGSCEGRIARSPSGTSGFGYDPVFLPVGYDASFAELGPDVKGRLSHRSIALSRLRPLLDRRLRA